MVQKEVKSKTRFYAIAAVFMAVALVGTIYTVTSPTVMYTLTGISPMKNFASTDELRNFLTANTQGDGTTYYAGGPLDAQRTNEVFTTGAKAPQALESQTSGIGYAPTPGSTDHSTTNVQVTGVDEADTVKTDGQYIYTLNVNYTTEPSNIIQIVKADQQNPQAVGQIAFNSSASLAGMYLSQDGNKLAVLGSNYNYYYYLPIAIEDGRVGLAYDYYSNNVNSFIYVYDVSNKASPVMTRNLTLSGSYFNSRMIGNYIYTVVSQPAYANNDTVILPQVIADSATKEIAPTSIYYTDMQDSYFTYNTFAGLNINNDNEQPTDMTILMGGSSCMYVSTENMYVTFPNSTGEATEIYRVTIDGANLTFDAKGIVPGYILNQYSMDEYNGYFRVATTVSTGSWVNRDQHNNLYVLDMDLNVVGQIENLAQGERIYSARFAGDKAYIVTFKQVDPFFVIDLKDPTAPKVTGELKIPGYSSYLHPYDENYVIGIGKENQTVKLSLFDVTDMSNPTEVAKYVIGSDADYTESTALYEPKAFLFDLQKQLLVIPVSITNYGVIDEPKPEMPTPTTDSITRDDAGTSSSSSSPRYTQPTLWQGAYVFKLTPAGFTLQGEVSHQSSQTNSYWYWYNDEAISRSLYIGNTLYTISNGIVQLNSLGDLSLLGKVTF